MTLNYKKHSLHLSLLSSVSFTASVSVLALGIWSKYIISSLRGNLISPSEFKKILSNPLFSELQGNSMVSALNNISGVNNLASINFVSAALKNNIPLHSLSLFLGDKANVELLKILFKSENLTAFESFLHKGAAASTIQSLEGLQRKLNVLEAFKKLAGDTRLLESVKTLFPDQNSMKAFAGILKDTNELEALKGLIKHSSSTAKKNIGDLLQKYSANLQRDVGSRQKIIIAFAVIMVLVVLTLSALVYSTVKYRALRDEHIEGNKSNASEVEKKGNTKKSSMSAEKAFYAVLGISALAGIELTAAFVTFMLLLPSSKQMLLNIADNSSKALPIAMTLLVFVIPAILVLGGKAIFQEKSTFMEGVACDELEANKQKC